MRSARSCDSCLSPMTSMLRILAACWMGDSCMVGNKQPLFQSCVGVQVRRVGYEVSHEAGGVLGQSVDGVGKLLAL